MSWVVTETPRLVIREYSPQDAPALVEMNADPRVLRYCVRQPYTTLPEAELYTQNYARQMYDAYGFGRWAVATREDGRTIGYCGIKFRPGKNLVDLGYRYLSSHWGKGYATEAAKASVDYAFGKLKLASLSARAEPANTASCHVLEKAGFRRTDIVREDGSDWQYFSIENPDAGVAPTFVPVIETERLLLRRMMECDTRVMFALNADPEVLRYTGDKVFDTPEDAYRFLSDYQDVYRKHGFARWTVILKETGETLGWCGLRRYADTAPIDLGYRLFRKAWNKGYATEASLACLKYGFETLGFDRITARAHVDNVGSYRVMQKCGMTFCTEEFFEGMGQTVLYEIFRPGK